ncbi:DUF4328 domain-containing protein [Neptunicella marina]|nr:DUF4328 domain-containing protein [Neptunicella marina]
MDFKHSKNLTKWVRYILCVQIVLAIISIGSNFLEYQLLTDLQNGAYVSQIEAFDDAESSDRRQQILNVINIIVFIISGLLILIWIYRANYNSHQLGAKDMDFTPGWSIGYFFIPILALWKPYLAMKEIWQTSHNPNNWALEQAGTILRVWWFFWIVSNIVAQIGFRVSLEPKELQDFINSNIVMQISDLLTIPLAASTLILISSIYKAQYAALKAKQTNEDN